MTQDATFTEHRVPRSYGNVYARDYIIMNLASRAEAHQILEKLPLGVAGMMEFELIALGPLAPLAMLIGEPPKATT